MFRELCDAIYYIRKEFFFLSPSNIHFSRFSKHMSSRFEVILMIEIDFDRYPWDLGVKIFYWTVIYVSVSSTMGIECYAFHIS